MTEKQKVLLVRPFIRDYVNSQSSSSFESSIGLVPPLNLCCLAAKVEEAGYAATIYDCEAEGSSDEDFGKSMRALNPDVIGISAITTNFRGALETARMAREAVPEAIIVCGGAHVMIFPEETLSFDVFDYCFVGEAEESFVSFLDQLNSASLDVSVIPGLAYRTEEGVRVNEPYGFNEDIDSLPFPAYHLLDLSKYTMPNTGDSVVSLFLSRGCPFKCGFCFRNPQLQKVRFKSVDRIIEEITYMVERFGVRSINFVDETISLKKDYFLEFCAKLSAKSFDLEWQSPTRVTSLDEETVRAARKSGCHTLRLGIESGSDEILKKINKGITADAARNAVALCKKYGIKTVGYFIIGYLGETEETVRQTIKFAKEISPDFAAFFPATPMPATELYDESVEMGLVPKDYWRDFVLGKRSDALPFIFPNAGQWTTKAYRTFYFSPRYIARQMKTRKFYVDFFKNCIVALRLLGMKFQRSD